MTDPNNRKMIGVVGGVGPYAGLDLVRKIFDQTLAQSDQEHLSVVLLSVPEAIEDRTSFLLRGTDENPAFALCDVIRKLEEIGAGVIGIPCNTAHSPRIFNVILEKLSESASTVTLLHMIRETADFIKEVYPDINDMGILCTAGTYKTPVYQTIFESNGIKTIFPDKAFQATVHNAIYDPEYGIKARSNPVSGKACEDLLLALGNLQAKGAEAVVLGCTEIPLAVYENNIGGIPIIDPTLILARALIREVCPKKLKLYQG